LDHLLIMRGEVSEVRSTVGRVLEQTTITNGRVNALEDWRMEHDHKVDLQDTAAATRRKVRESDFAKLRWIRELIIDDGLKVLVVAGAASLGTYLIGRW